jgi:hypothetical protein
MAAAESASAPTSITPGGSSQPSPHVKILAVRPRPAPVVGATTDEPVRQGPPKGKAAAAFPEEPAPQASASSQTSAQATGLVPAAPTPWPDARPAFATVNAREPVAVPTEARAASVQPQARAHASYGARGVEPTANVGLAVIIFPMLALGLVAAAALSRVGMSIVAARRARPMVHHLESSWDDDQRQHELRDHQEEYGSGELQEYPTLISAVSDYDPRVPFRADDDWPDSARGDSEAGQIQADDEWPDNARGHGDAGQIQADDEWPGNARGHGDAGQIQADAEWPRNARGHGDAGQITEEVSKREDTSALLDRLLRSPKMA